MIGTNLDPQLPDRQRTTAHPALTGHDLRRCSD
jgi:hypothetical protein